MKKRLLVILSTVVFTIMLGYLFLLSWLIGFLASKFMAGKSAGERGKIRSVVIPLRRWGIHLHHWLYSLFLIGLSFATGTHFITPEITYGLLGGLVFQGIYCYGDWHVILVSRHQPEAGERSVNTSKNGARLGSIRPNLHQERKPKRR